MNLIHGIGTHVRDNTVASCSGAFPNVDNSEGGSDLWRSSALTATPSTRRPPRTAENVEPNSIPRLPPSPKAMLPTSAPFLGTSVC